MSGYVEDEIWALQLAPHKTYSQNVQMPFCIKMAALDRTITNPARSSVILRLDETEYVLCSLTPGKIEQQILSQTIVAGENITLFTDGENTIHLTGNFLTQEEGPSYDVDGEYSDDESEFDSDEYDDDSFIDDGSEEDSDSKTPKIEEIADKPKKERKNAISDSEEEEPELQKSLRFEAEVDKDSDDVDSDEDSDEMDSDENSEEMDSDSEGFDSDDFDDSEEGSEESSSEEEAKANLGEKRTQPTPEQPNKRGRQDSSTVQPKPTPSKSQKQQPAKQHTPQKGQSQQSSTSQKDQPQQQSSTPQKNQQSSTSQKNQQQNTTPQKSQQQNSTPQKSQQQTKQSTPVTSEKGQTTPKKQDSAPSTPQKGASEFKKISGGVEIKDVALANSSKKVKKGSKVSIVYKGTLANGKVFDSNNENNLLDFQVGKGQVIKGMEFGVEGMSLNSTRIIKIPANLAYGNKKIPGIPPNSELTFQIQVKRID